jgi:hypothetical protein
MSYKQLYGDVYHKLQELNDMVEQYPDLAENHQKAADDYKAGKITEEEWKTIDNEFHMIRKLMGS